MILLAACGNNDDGGRGLPGSITNCCGDLGPLDTRGLVMYYSMDNLPDTIPDGMDIQDGSGRGNNGKFVMGGSIDTTEVERDVSLSTDGLIGQGIYIAKWDYIAVLDKEENEDFQFGTGDFTWSMWVKPSELGILNNNKNQIWIGAQTDAVVEGLSVTCGNGTHMWLGLMNTDVVNWQLRAIGKDNLAVGNQDYQQTTVNTGGLAGKWHHIVAVKDGHEYANISIYIDGKEVEKYTYNFEEISRDQTIAMSEDYEFSRITNLYLGKFPPPCSGSFGSTITLDEVSIWNRPLSKSEVEMLYKRQSDN